METMTMTVMPMAVAELSDRRAASSVVRLPRISGAMSSIAFAGGDCTWSPNTTTAHATRTAAAFPANHLARKAYGTRRLGETST
jgi:hypothetical protein